MGSIIINNIAKITMDPRVECSYQSNFFRSYHEFLHRACPNFIFRIWTKHQLQNLNRTSSSRLNLNFKILSRISTKIQLHNLYKTSAAKYCSNFNFKTLTNPSAQSLNKSLALGPNVTSQICNKLLPT